MGRKLALHVLTLAYIIMFIAVGIQLYGMNGKIEKNIVKIIKEVEIVRNYENNLEMDTNNYGENIFSGFFIDAYTIITTAHGVNKDTSVYTIIDFEGNEYKAFVKEIDLENDIAYLEVNRKFNNYSRVKYAKEIDIGDKVFSQNYKGEKKEGIVEAVNEKIISSNILFKEGDSGSPLLNEENRIVGINVEINLNSNSGISYSLINTN